MCHVYRYCSVISNGGCSTHASETVEIDIRQLPDSIAARNSRCYHTCRWLTRLLPRGDMHAGSIAHASHGKRILVYAGLCRRNATSAPLQMRFCFQFANRTSCRCTPSYAPCTCAGKGLHPRRPDPVARCPTPHTHFLSDATLATATLRPELGRPALSGMLLFPGGMPFALAIVVRLSDCVQQQQLSIPLVS